MKRLIYIILSLVAISVFDCDYKLHVVEPKIVDPKTHRVTSGPWSHAAPAWSPDGSRLAFSRRVSDTHLWYHSLTGTKSGIIARIKRDDIKGRMALSPDGQKIAYHSSYREHLWVYSTLDDSEVLLTPGDSLAYDPAWSRDRRQIAYATMTEDSVYQLRVLPSEGGTPEVLYESKSVRLDWPSWSPDGQKIACSYYESDSSFHQIALFSLTDRRLETITSHHYDSRYPDWSPDGNRVAFYSPRASGGSIWLLSLDNKELTQLPLTRDVGTYPCWSPDGSYLAIGSPSITYIYSIADDRLTQVSSGGFISPQWLPDSKSLVGSKSSSSGYSEICIISLESLEVTPVTTPKENYSDTHPTWFPNNTDIAFYRYHEGILKTSLHGGSLVRLLSDVYQDPEISPDGKKIIFEYFSYSIGIADLDTKASLEITREYRDYMFAAFNKEVSLRDPTWSPDTTKFACCSNDSLIIFRIEGKKAVKESGFAGRFYDPSWSAEHPVFGSHLAAESGDGSIYMISPETHEINRIIEIGLDPCWSPDGTSLAYVDKNGHIYVKQVLFNLSK